MGIFRRKSTEPSAPEPTPFVAEILRRIGAEYGGFDAVAPLVPDKGGPGMELTIHIAGAPIPGREPLLHGTGIVRTVRSFAAHTEVYDGDRQIARYDDLTTADVFGARGS